MPPMPPPPVRNLSGWSPQRNLAPRGQKGVSFRCHRPGHYIAECPVSPAHMNVAVPFTAHHHPYPLHYGGGWVQEPRPSSDGCSHDQTSDGSCVPTSNPHLLTAHVAQQGKDGCDDFFWGGTGREEWVADSGATFHVTGNPVGMVECNPPPLGRRSLVIGDMRSLKIEYFGNLPMVMHSQQGDVQIKLLNVAYVPGVHFNMFSLHAVMPKCSVSLDAEGVHMLDGELSFMRRDTGSYVEATRVVETPIAAAVSVSYTHLTLPTKA